jgi:Holliday junction resolvasome RuvABC ATP-dependent DNA helicase subunit
LYLTSSFTIERYKIDESSKPRDTKIDPRVVAVYKNVAELVGIDGPRDELVKWLSSKEGESAHTHHKTVSIVGYGGLGKTTLAKQVYDKLGANFECRAFVSISRSPDMRKILSSLLSEISNGREHARESAQQIIDQIREVLKQKR